MPKGEVEVLVLQVRKSIEDLTDVFDDLGRALVGVKKKKKKSTSDVEVWPAWNLRHPQEKKKYQGLTPDERSGLGANKKKKPRRDRHSV